MSLSQDKSKIDQSLKQLEEDITWQEHRQLQVKHKLFQQMNSQQGKKRPYRFIGIASSVVMVLLLCFGAYYFFTTDIVQDDTQADLNIGEDEIVSAGFLWEVQHGDTTLYILGSIMATDERMYPLRNEILDAFNRSNVLISFDAENMNHYHNLYLEYSRYEDGSTLQDNISPELYERLDEVLRGSYLRAEQFREFKPLYIYNIIEGRLLTDIGLDYELWPENYFLSNAHEDMRIVSIESLSIEALMESLEEYRNLDHDIQENILAYGLDRIEVFEEEYHQKIDYWIQGDFEALAELYHNFKDGSPEVETYLKSTINQSNRALINQLSRYLESNTGDRYFIVVDSFNLVGDKGLIALLKDKGFEVRRR